MVVGENYNGIFDKVQVILVGIFDYNFFSSDRICDNLLAFLLWQGILVWSYWSGRSSAVPFLSCYIFLLVNFSIPILLVAIQAFNEFVNGGDFVGARIMAAWDRLLLVCHVAQLLPG